MAHYWESAEGLREIAEVRHRFPSLTLRHIPERGAQAFCGVLEAAPSVAYSVTLVLPPKYPNHVPVLYCNPAEIPISAERHFFTDTGSACLCAMSEYRIHWPHGSGLVAFFERLVIPFLISQFYFQTHGVWPPTGQRAHGPKGILEAYADIAAPLGDASVPTIRALMLYLARKGEPKGHEACPCGSGLILRKCHAEAVRRLRTQIQREHARADLLFLARFKVSPFYPVPPHF
jgi:hypothetical protein